MTDRTDKQIFQAGFKAGTLNFAAIVRDMLDLDQDYPYDQTDVHMATREFEKWDTTSSQADSPTTK